MRSTCFGPRYRNRLDIRRKSCVPTEPPSETAELKAEGCPTSSRPKGSQTELTAVVDALRSSSRAISREISRALQPSTNFALWMPVPLPPLVLDIIERNPALEDVWRGAVREARRAMVAQAKTVSPEKAEKIIVEQALRQFLSQSEELGNQNQNENQNSPAGADAEPERRNLS